MAKFMLGWLYVVPPLWIMYRIFKSAQKVDFTLIMGIISCAGSLALGGMMIFLGAVDLYFEYADILR